MYTSRANPIGYTPSGVENPVTKLLESMRAEDMKLKNEKETLCRMVYEELKTNDRGFTKEQIYRIYVVCVETSAKIDKSQFRT